MELARIVHIVSVSSTSDHVIHTFDLPFTMHPDHLGVRGFVKGCRVVTPLLWNTRSLCQVHGLNCVSVQCRLHNHYDFLKTGYPDSRTTAPICFGIITFFLNTLPASVLALCEVSVNSREM